MFFLPLYKKYGPAVKKKNMVQTANNTNFKQQIQRCKKTKILQLDWTVAINFCCLFMYLFIFPSAAFYFVLVITT